MSQGLLGIPWLVWSGLALAVAVIFVFVVPAQKLATASGLRYFLLRWGHSAVWLLLAISFALRGIAGGQLAGIPNLIALGALGMYLAFLYSVLTK